MRIAAGPAVVVVVVVVVVATTTWLPRLGLVATIAAIAHFPFAVQLVVFAGHLSIVHTRRISDFECVPNQYRQECPRRRDIGSKSWLYPGRGQRDSF